MASKEKLRKYAEEHLDLDEKVLSLIKGTYEARLFGSDTVRSGILLATNKRLVMYSSRMTGFDLEIFPYENISSFESGKSIMGHHITFFASNNKFGMKWITDNEFSAFVSIVRSRLGTPTTNVAAIDDIPSQIVKLSDLKKSGILTQAEFETKKTELLSRM